MASMRSRSRKDGTTYVEVMFRLDGRQRSISFTDKEHAQKFVDLVDLVGPAKALEAYSLDSTPRASNGSSTTVSEWMKHHIDLLSGVNPITVAKYEAYLKNDIGPVFGHQRLADVSRDDVARWAKPRVVV